MRQALELALEALDMMIVPRGFQAQVRVKEIYDTIEEALAQPDKTSKLYEELRSIIDGGSESFTHEDAVQYLKDKLAQPDNQGKIQAVDSSTERKAD